MVKVLTIISEFSRDLWKSISFSVTRTRRIVYLFNHACDILSRSRRYGFDIYSEGCSVCVQTWPRTGETRARTLFYRYIRRIRPFQRPSILFHICFIMVLAVLTVCFVVKQIWNISLETASIQKRDCKPPCYNTLKWLGDFKQQVFPMCLRVLLLPVDTRFGVVMMNH